MNMSKKIVIDKFHQHEVLDRLSVYVDSINSYVTEHAYMSINHKAQKKVKNAMSLLLDAYQLVANDDERFKD
jgi:hypothetical protein